MLHVHVVGLTSSRDALPIDLPSLFAQLVYCTPKLEHAEFSRSSWQLPSSDEDQQADNDQPRWTENALLESRSAEVAKEVCYSFSDTLEYCYKTANPRIPFDIVVCTDAAVHDGVVDQMLAVADSMKESDDISSSSCGTSSSCSSYPRHDAVVLAVHTDAPSRLPMLYGQLIGLLIQEAVEVRARHGQRSRWTHVVDRVVEKFESTRSSSVVFSIVPS